MAITPVGVALLSEAVQVWHETHRVLDEELGPARATRLRADLGALRAGGPRPG